MSHELIRSIIVFAGWPILFIGGLWALGQAYAFYDAVQRSVYGKLVLLMVSGWLLTMLCLGLVSTWFLYEDPEAAVWIVAPVFGVWTFSMAIFLMAVRRWNRSADQLDDHLMRMEELVRERTALLEGESKKMQNLNMVLEQRVALKSKELERQIAQMQKINRELGAREKRMQDIKAQLDQLDTLIDTIDGEPPPEKPQA